MPVGFLSLDLAKALSLPLIDPDQDYKAIDAGQHPKSGNGLIGGDKDHPKVVVAANGGSDLIYLPDGDKAMAKNVVDALLKQDYVSGIFVARSLGAFPGTLSLDDIALEGTAVTPMPAIAVNFRSFRPICGQPERCTAEVADSGLQQGQGMHGSFSRADTWNFQAMIGPDFKSGFVDAAPTSNADVGKTIARILDLQDRGQGQARRPRHRRSDEGRHDAGGRHENAGVRTLGQRPEDHHRHADWSATSDISTPPASPAAPSASPSRTARRPTEAGRGERRNGAISAAWEKITAEMALNLGA